MWCISRSTRLVPAMVVVMVAAAVVLLLARPVRSRPCQSADDRELDTTLFAKALEDYNHVQKLRCLEPRRVVHPVQHFYSSNDPYMTDNVLLYRCGHSGCCSSSEVCAPVERHCAEIPVVLNRFGQQNEPYTRVLRFDNHTVCGCVAPNDVEPDPCGSSECAEAS